MKIKVFADGADYDEIRTLSKDDNITGFTTNPSLMAKSGVKDYKEFSMRVIEILDGKPVSLEVFSDDIEEMKSQAKKIASWDDSIYVKIPVTNSKGVSTEPIIESLSNDGIKLNITALFTEKQVTTIMKCLNKDVNSIISIFAGRIANAGVNPIPLISSTVNYVNDNLKKSEVLWASAREPYNIIEANNCGCHIITLPINFIKSMSMFGKDLEQYSLETVKMFYDDAVKSNFKID